MKESIPNYEYSHKIMKCGDKVEQIIHMKKRLMVTFNWLLKSSHYYKIMQEH